MKHSLSEEEKFWHKVEKTAKCWIWTGYKNKKGYGTFYKITEKQTVRAHRFSYELHKGKFNKKLLICHKCDNPSCVNPEHLFLGTAKDNTNDCIKKGRFTQKNYNSMANKTHCKQGHKFTKTNTKIYNGNYRRCIKCRRTNALNRHYKKNTKCVKGHEFKIFTKYGRSCGICIANGGNKKLIKSSIIS